MTTDEWLQIADTASILAAFRHWLERAQVLDQQCAALRQELAQIDAALDAAPLNLHGSRDQQIATLVRLLRGAASL